VEGLAILVVLALLSRFGLSWQAAPYAVVVTAALATALTDLRQRRIPNRIVFPAVAACAGVMLVASIEVDQPERLGAASVGAGL
ncbi:MAG: hypothetical protein AAFO29_07255, partial [Actinomycetota bacterium]